MPNPEEWQAGLFEEFDSFAEGQRDRYVEDVGRIYNDVDVALISIGKQLDPNHIWRPISRGETPSLEDFGVLGDNGQVEKYHVPKGLFGDAPENLEADRVYLFSGVASEELACLALSYAHATPILDGSYSGYVLGRSRGIELYQNAPVEFLSSDGRDCDTCRTYVPSISFQLLGGDGEPLLDENYIPRTISTLKGLFSVALYKTGEPEFLERIT